MALTRARERLIIEWPQPDGAKDQPFPITARRLLADQAMFRIVENTVVINGQTFLARIIVCDQDLPASFDAAAEPLDYATAREPRLAVIPRTTPPRILVVSPSQATVTHRPVSATMETRTICAGVQVISPELMHPAAKGTAIHEGLRILLQRPDLLHHVAAHCRLNDKDVAALAVQALALRAALAELGHATLHVEQPLEIPLADGGMQAAFIDLIAEGPGGYIIVDHKSGAVPDHADRLAEYWPQLAAYVDAVEAIAPHPARAAAIFWTDIGELTLVNLAKAIPASPDCMRLLWNFYIIPLLWTSGSKLRGGHASRKFQGFDSEHWPLPNDLLLRMPPLVKSRPARVVVDQSGASNDSAIVLRQALSEGRRHGALSLGRGPRPGPRSTLQASAAGGIPQLMRAGHLNGGVGGRALSGKESAVAAGTSQ